MQRQYLPLATIILLVAAFLRFWQLDLYPPGPHYDEGAYLLITRSIAFGGARFFPIVEAYQGREVLYMYLNAPLLTLFGDHMLTLRITSAMLNLITLAASMTLARRMFRGERGMIIALVVGVIFLLSFPQLFIARQAFRAVTLPFMQALALLFLWHGLRGERRWGWLALAGLFAGGAVYTYMASRLFPFWLALAALALLWSDRLHWRARLTQGVVFFGVLALTAAPMAIYALQKPDIFWGRLGEVTQTSAAVSLAESSLLHLRMFFLEGDPYFRYNIAGRPYFTLPEGILLLIGLCMCIAALLRRNTRPIGTPAYALVLLAPLMVIPSVISTGGLPPSHMRSLGMIPLIFITVGIGFEAVYRSAANRWHFDRPRALAIFALASALLGGIWIGQMYFAWAATAELFYETDADLSAAARWLGDHTQTGERIYLAARDRSHPTVLIEQTPPITWIGTDTLFVPPHGESGLYVFPRSAPPPPDWATWLEPGRIADLPLAPDGRTAFEAFRTSGDSPLPDSVEAGERVANDYLDLLGSYGTGDISAGARGELVALWRVLAAPPDSDFTPLIQLVTHDGIVLSRNDVYMTDANAWEPGAVLMIRLPVDVPMDAAPGDYSVEVAWVARDRDQYAPYRNDDGTQAGIWSEIGSVEVARPPQPPMVDSISMQTRIMRDFDGVISLIGYDAPPSSLRPGENIALRLVWRALRDAPADMPYRLMLRGERDVILHDALPLAGHFPPANWRTGDVLREDLHRPLPRDLANGVYALIMEMDDEQIELGELQIEGVARVFEPPPVEVMTGAIFGEQIALYGYTLTERDHGFEMMLVWRAETYIEREYTVFVHLVNADGTMVTQRDSMPMQNSYPTSLWLPDEYVTDRYLFDSALSNRYNLRIGLYDAETGTRLPLLTQSSGAGSDFFVVTLSAEDRE
jgi:4-amino-4-deoxy-L-arabinose transferase-like glycosyltransferase